MAIVRFGDVVKRANTRVDKDNTELEFYVGGEHIETGELIINRRGIIKGSTIGPMFYFGFKAGQVLIVSRNPHLKKAGMVKFDGICSEKTFVVESVDESILLQEFLPFIVQSEGFWRHAEEHKSGSVNYFVNWTTFAKYEFELPSLEIQQQLKELLWAAVDTKETYKKLLNLTNDLIKAQFVKMFGLPGNDEKGWGLSTLGDCCEINPKKSKDLRLHDMLEISFVPMSAVSEKGTIDTSVTRKYENVKKGFTYFAENDVLFAKITPCMENGKGAVATGLSNGIGFGSTEFHILRPINGISNPYWIYQLTMFPEFRINAEKEMTGTGGQRRVPVSYLTNYAVSLPPIELQNQFEDFVKQANKSIFKLEQTILSLENTIKSIMKRYIG